MAKTSTRGGTLYGGKGPVKPAVDPKSKATTNMGTPREALYGGKPAVKPAVDPKSKATTNMGKGT